MADEALVLHLLDDTELLVGRHRRVDAVQLPQVDAVDRESTQGHLHALTQVLGAAHDLPAVRSLAGEAALRCDDDVPVRVERLADEVLADERPVGVGGVDEVDAELDRATQHRNRGVAVRRVAPDAGAGDAHGSEAEATDGQRITASLAESEGAAGQDGGARKVAHWLIQTPPRDTARSVLPTRRAAAVLLRSAVKELSGILSSWLAPDRPCGEGGQRGRLRA